jgi:hypothetical protein
MGGDCPGGRAGMAPGTDKKAGGLAQVPFGNFHRRLRTVGE